MAGAMRQAGQRVAGAVAGLFIRHPYGIVDRAGGRADARCLERDLLAAPDQIPQLALALARFAADDDGARDVRLVAFVGTAAVHQQDAASLGPLDAAGTVWIGARLIGQDQRPRRRATQPCHRHHQRRCNLGCRQVGLQLRGNVGIGGKRDVRRPLHQRDLGRRFDDAAGAHDTGVVAGFDTQPAQAVDGEEADRLLDADRTGTGAARAQPVGDSRGRVFMFVPGTHVGGDAKRLAD